MNESNEHKYSKALSKLLHPFQLSRKWRFVFLILLNLVLKTAFLFVRIFPDDVDFYRATGYLLLYGSLPYADFYLPGASYYDWHMVINSLHPNGPLNYIFYGYWMKLFGDDVWAIKLPWLISEIFISICIYMIAEDLMNQNKAFLCSLLYTIMPVSYFPGIFVGCDELITLHSQSCRLSILQTKILGFGNTARIGYILQAFPRVCTYSGILLFLYP